MARRSRSSSVDDRRTGRRIIAYPTNRLLAVLDPPVDEAAVRAALVDVGFAPDDVVAIEPAREPDLAALGSGRGLRSRLRRLIQFVMMDQTPDLILYEAALHAGRTVVAVRCRSRAQALQARSVLVRLGAHFVNWFGALATEEFELWRGEEPPIPEYLRR